MLAVAAVIAFALALIFHLAGGNVAPYVTDAFLAGMIALALHLLVPGWPWKRG
jgi:hypothetical protein